jgi:hypothetical protein
MRNVLADLASSRRRPPSLAMRLAAPSTTRCASDERAFLRLAVPAGKYWVCKRARRSVRRWSAWAATATSRSPACPGCTARRRSTRSGRAPGNVQALDVLRALRRERFRHRTAVHQGCRGLQLGGFCVRSVSRPSPENGTMRRVSQRSDTSDRREGPMAKPPRPRRSPCLPTDVTTVAAVTDARGRMLSDARHATPSRTARARTHSAPGDRGSPGSARCAAASIPTTICGSGLLSRDEVERRRGTSPLRHVLPVLREGLVSVADVAHHIMVVADDGGPGAVARGQHRRAAQGRRGSASRSAPTGARTSSAPTAWAPRRWYAGPCRSSPPSISRAHWPPGPVRGRSDHRPQGRPADRSRGCQRPAGDDAPGHARLGRLGGQTRRGPAARAAHDLAGAAARGGGADAGPASAAGPWWWTGTAGPPR